MSLVICFGKISLKTGNSTREQVTIHSFDTQYFTSILLNKDKLIKFIRV